MRSMSISGVVGKDVKSRKNLLFTSSWHVKGGLSHETIGNRFFYKILRKVINFYKKIILFFCRKKNDLFLKVYHFPKIFKKVDKSLKGFLNFLKKS